MFVGISQDIIIRNATSNKKSIDNLMRILFRKCSESNTSYTMEELRRTMSDLSGIDQTKFFDTYIIGTKMLPIAEYLKMAGLNAKIENENLEISKIETITPEQQNILNGMLGRINSN
jgi:predicted metalloprotease with PDZ domain